MDSGSAVAEGSACDGKLRGGGGKPAGAPCGHLLSCFKFSSSIVGLSSQNPGRRCARMDLLGMLDGADARSETSSAAPFVPREANPDRDDDDLIAGGPPPKRARASYVTKIGIGNVGVLLLMAQEIFGASYEKMTKKACMLCKNFMLTPDPVQPELSRAWHKPNFEGKVCAYCGVGKNKLWPHKSVTDCVLIIDTQPEEIDRFFKFTNGMVLAYQSGDKQARCLTDAPTESLQKVTSTNFDAKVDGKMSGAISRAAFWAQGNKLGTNI